MNIDEKREKLFSLLFSKSFMYRDDPPFKLASGALSPYYFNCKAVTLDPEGCSLIGTLMFNAIKDMGAQAIGGLTLGADPISIATSLEAFNNGTNLLPVIVRKEAKKHGTQKWIEGNLDNVKRIIAIDDVITTGGSTIKAIDRMRESGLEVIKTLVLIDRQEGGRENIEEKGVQVLSLFNRSEFDLRRKETNS